MGVFASRHEAGMGRRETPRRRHHALALRGTGPVALLEDAVQWHFLGRALLRLRDAGVN